MKQYQNPIRRGMYPDPSIVRVDDTFYLVNSTFEYYPGISVSRSHDLINWEQLPGVVQTPQQADLRQSKSNEGIFAVCIRYHEGNFYVITTNFAEFKTFMIKGHLSDNRQQIVWDKQRVEIDVPGIDPDLYFEGNHTYVQFTGYIDKQGTKAIRQVEIDATTGKILKGPEILTYGTGGRDVEGPHIIKKDQAYYLLVAEGGTGQGHMITIFRSDHLWGPYTDEPGVNPLFTNRDRPNEPLQNIGHGDLFTDQQGHWWLTCLGTLPGKVGFTAITNIGRETLLYPVNWQGKWPQIYQGVPSQVVDMTDYPLHAQVLPRRQMSSKFVDNFESGVRPEWLTLRNTLEDDFQVSEGKGVLRGRPTLLNELGTPAFIGLRQAENEEKLVVDLDGDQSRLDHGRFGLAVLINVDHYAAILLQKSDTTGFDVYRTQQVADIQIDYKIGHLDNLPSRFVIEHSAAQKKFSAVTDHKSVEFTTDAINLSNEALAALNTGDIQGLYATQDAKLAVTQVVREPIEN